MHLVTHGGPVTTRARERVVRLQEETRRWDLWADHTRVIPVCGENHCRTTELPLTQSQL